MSHAFLCYFCSIPTQTLATYTLKLQTTLVLPSPHDLLTSPHLSSPLFSSPSKTCTVFFRRHWVDVHQEAHASRYHHWLRIRSGLHAASRHSILDTRLEKVAARYISPGLPAHLLYMVGNLNAALTLDPLCTHTFLWQEDMNALFVTLLSFLSSFLALSFAHVHPLCSPLAPCLLSLSPVRVLPQSARWLLANNRSEEAIALLRKAALVNGRVLPPAVQVCHSTPYRQCELLGSNT